MGKLDGKVAIITGAAQGMGEAHARRFVAEGAKVVLTDVQEETGARLAAELGADALFVKQDVTSLEDWQAVAARTVEAFGTIDILVNNAGTLGPIANVVDLDPEAYLKVVAINQHSQIWGMKTVIPIMQQAGGGSIVNISSTAGMVAVVGAPSVGYVGSKFASRGVTKQVAVEFGPDNIRVNSVHPGYILTPMMVEATDDEGGGVGDITPLRRMAAPDEVSSLVLFLASEDSSYITGMEHVIDGGLTAS
jgi:3alpha(or 20beta)-hydroxysteroid dehydrogenase